MLSNSFLNVVLLAASTAAYAVPGGSGGGYSGGGGDGGSYQDRQVCITYVDTYDDIVADPLVSTPVGTYHGLVYQAWDASEADMPTSPFAPHSNPNVAVASIQTDIEQLGNVALFPFGNIVAGPNINSFNLFSFYFGCGVNLDDGSDSVGSAAGCALSITGFDIYGNQIPTFTVSFAPTVDTQAQMKLVSFPSSYIDLQNITIGIAAGGLFGVTADGSVGIDNLVHCNNVYYYGN